VAFDLTGRLTLIDQMTAPLKNATKAMSNLGKATGQPRSALTGFATSGKNAGAWGMGFSSGMSGVISTLGKVATAIGVVKFATDTVSKAMDFESAVAGFASVSPRSKGHDMGGV
jgi:hypothetical protein